MCWLLGVRVRVRVRVKARIELCLSAVCVGAHDPRYNTGGASRHTSDCIPGLYNGTTRDGTETSVYWRWCSVLSRPVKPCSTLFSKAVWSGTDCCFEQDGIKTPGYRVESVL